MTAPYDLDGDKPLITDPVKLAAAYGIQWPTGSCTCCGAAIRDGRCHSWDEEITDRPEDCTCATGEEPS